MILTNSDCMEMAGSHCAIIYPTYSIVCNMLLDDLITDDVYCDARRRMDADHLHLIIENIRENVMRII